MAYCQPAHLKSAVMKYYVLQKFEVIVLVLHSHIHFYLRVRFITMEYKVCKFEIINLVNFPYNIQCWKRTGGSF